MATIINKKLRFLTILIKDYLANHREFRSDFYFKLGATLLEFSSRIQFLSSGGYSIIF